MEYKAYAITVRPRNGISDDQISSIMKFLRSRCDFYIAVTEKTADERHLHAGLFLKAPTTRSKLNDGLKNLKCFQAMDFSEKSVLRNGTKIMYNRDWCNKYLMKGDDTVIIASNLPEEKYIDSYFPPKEEQDKAQRQKRIKDAKSGFYQKLEEMWYQQMPPGVEPTYGSVVNFLCDNQFNKRTIRVMKDEREWSRHARNLVRYITKATREDLVNYYEKDKPLDLSMRW